MGVWIISVWGLSWIVLLWHSTSFVLVSICILFCCLVRSRNSDRRHIQKVYVQPFQSGDREYVLHFAWKWTVLLCIFIFLGEYISIYYLKGIEKCSFSLAWFPLFAFIWEITSYSIGHMVWSKLGVNAQSCPIPICQVQRKTFVTLYFYNASLWYEEAPSFKKRKLGGEN